MRKKTGPEGPPKKRRTSHKLTDLSVKPIKGGDAATVKGGCGTGMSKDVGQV